MQRQQLLSQPGIRSHGHVRHQLIEIWNEVAASPRVTLSESLLSVVTRGGQNLAAAPVNSLLTVLVIASVLLVCGGFLVLSEGVTQAIKQERSELQLSVFVRDGIERQAQLRLKEELESRPDVAHVRSYSKRESLADFRASLGLNAVILEGLENDNPLPASLEVTFVESDAMLAYFRALRRELRRHPAVESIQYNKTYLLQLSRIIQYVGGGVVVGLLLLLVFTGFIISNTINLALYAHRDEIEVMSLLGASSYQLRARYFMEGALQGLFGGLFSLAALYGLLLGLQYLFVSESTLTALPLKVGFLSLSESSLVVGVGVVLGVIGSYAAVSRFLFANRGG